MRKRTGRTGTTMVASNATTRLISVKHPNINHSPRPAFHESSFSISLSRSSSDQVMVKAGVDDDLRVCVFFTVLIIFSALVSHGSCIVLTQLWVNGDWLSMLPVMVMIICRYK